MHPFLPLPINFDTSIPAGWGLLEWHIVVTPDLDTLMMALPAGTDAEFQMGDEEENDDARGSDEEGTGAFEPEGLPCTGNPLGEFEEDEPEEDASRHGRGCFGRLPQVNRRLNSPVRWIQ